MKLRKRQPERQPASELRQALEARGATIRQAVRALLRDFGYGTVTPRACQEVQRKLEEAGIAYEPSLVDAKPSQMITLSLAVQARPAEEAQPIEAEEAQPIEEPMPAEAEAQVYVEAEDKEVAPEIAAEAAKVNRLQTLIESQQQAWEQQRAEAERRTAEALGALAESHEQNEHEREERTKLEQTLQGAAQTEHELRAELSNEHARRAQETAEAERTIAAIRKELDHERETRGNFEQRLVAAGDVEQQLREQIQAQANRPAREPGEAH